MGMESDPLHVMFNYGVPRSNKPFGIPEIIKQDIDPNQVTKLVSAGHLSGHLSPTDNLKEMWLHFYTDDHRFVRYWTHPWEGLKKVQQFAGAITPDFSTYPEWPLAINIWSVYRANWVSRFWQEHGVKVLPQANWNKGTDFELDWALAGIPEGCPFCFKMFVLDSQEANDRQNRGVREAIRRINPPWILCYSAKPFLWSKVYKGHDIPENLPELYFVPATSSFSLKRGSIAATVEHR